MKLSQLPAVGLLSAACLAGAIPSNAQSRMHPSPMTVQRIQSRAIFRQSILMPQTAFPQRNAAFDLGPGQTRNLGIATVTAVRATTLTVRFTSGTTGFITLSPRALQLSRLHTGSRLRAILRSDGSVLVFPMSRASNVPVRPQQ